LAATDRWPDTLVGCGERGICWIWRDLDCL